MNPAPERHVLIWPEHGVEMAFRLIPAGEFRMGSRGRRGDEEPVHNLRISEPFWLGETSVTQAQLAVWTRAEGVEHENRYKGPENPAENLRWWDAAAYCAWLAKVKAGELPQGYPLVCLPTEAEWEYACRAGTDTEYYPGDGAEALGEAGWFRENSEDMTHPVREKKPNELGLHDMHGNVWEWCHDTWDEGAYRGPVDGVIDPGSRERRREWEGGLSRMIASDQSRVLRGGSWFNSAISCRSAIRYGLRPVDRDGYTGFRVCLARGPAAGRGAPGGRTGAEAQSAPGAGSRGTRQEADGTDGAGAGLPDFLVPRLPGASRRRRS